MFTLLNKVTKQKLIHPRVGLWFTKELKEAQEMLAACREHLVASGLDHLSGQFCIVDAETDEEILC